MPRRPPRLPPLLAEFDDEEREAVLAANRAFYRAFAERDVDAMDQIWAPTGAVVCLHPGQPPLHGRAEIMAGRGSFIESFPLFGYDLDDYDELFAEKLDLLLSLRESERVTWSGKLRAPLDDLVHVAAKSISGQLELFDVRPRNGSQSSDRVVTGTPKPCAATSL